jgi:hypothetical protein
MGLTKKKYAKIGMARRRINMLENFNFFSRPAFILPIAWNKVQ